MSVLYGEKLLHDNSNENIDGYFFINKVLFSEQYLPIWRESNM